MDRIAGVIDTKKYYDNGMCEIRRGRGKVARARGMRRAAVSFAVHCSLDAGERVRVVVPVWGGR